MKKLRGLFVPLIVLFMWYIGSILHMFNDYIIPSPITVDKTAYTLFKSGILIKNLTVSFYRVFLGFVGTFMIAFPFAVLVGISKKFKSYVEPILEFIRHVPPIAVIPIFILWFGIGETSKFAVIFLATFFPVFSSALNGVTNYDKKLLEVGEVFNLSPTDKFFKIILPQAVPSIVTGIQLGLGYSWRSLVAAELIAASSGIGYMIMDAEQLSRPDIIIVGVLSIGLLEYIIDYVLINITNKFMRSYGKEVEHGGINSKEFIQDFLY